MKKALVPMVASLLLCGAATAALIANSANADPTPRRPMMVAMQGPPGLMQNVAATPDSVTGPQRPTTAEQTAQRRQICQDGYAHQVGELAYLEAKLNLTPAQQPLFDRWKSVKLDIAKRGEADCSTRELPVRNARTRPTPMDGMAREEDMLKRRLADLDAERPALATLYNALNQGQRDGLMEPGGGRIVVRRILADMGPPPGAMTRGGPVPVPPGMAPDGPPPP